MCEVYVVPRCDVQCAWFKYTESNEQGMEQRPFAPEFSPSWCSTLSKNIVMPGIISTWVVVGHLEVHSRKKSHNSPSSAQTECVCSYVHAIPPSTHVGGKMTVEWYRQPRENQSSRGTDGSNQRDKVIKIKQRNIKPSLLFNSLVHSSSVSLLISRLTVGADAPLVKDTSAATICFVAQFNFPLFPSTWALVWMVSTDCQTHLIRVLVAAFKDRKTDEDPSWCTGHSITVL